MAVTSIRVDIARVGVCAFRFDGYDWDVMKAVSPQTLREFPAHGVFARAYLVCETASRRIVRS
jgi:hypothetical protein